MDEDIKTTDQKNKYGFVKWIILGVLALILIAVIIDILANNKKSETVSEQLEEASLYESQLDYENAIEAYTLVTTLDSRNVEAYLGLVTCYIIIDENSNAYEWAKRGYEATEDIRLKNFMTELEALLESYDRPAT